MQILWIRTFSNSIYSYLFSFSDIEWSLSLFSPVYTLTGKPNSLHDSADGEEDGSYLIYIAIDGIIFSPSLQTITSVSMLFSFKMKVSWCFKFNFLDTFLQVITKAHRTPVEKFDFPLTANQEYGWDTQPLVRNPLIVKLTHCTSLQKPQLDKGSKILIPWQRTTMKMVTVNVTLLPCGLNFLMVAI